MPITQLVYASQPFGFDDLTLSSILAASGPNNIRDDITGALICREDLYLQLLEGPEAEVLAAFDRIARDERHTSVAKLVLRESDTRLFPNWAMRHDPAASWMWTPDQVSADTLRAAPEDDVIAVFQRLATAAPTTAQKCPFHRAAG